MRNDEYDSEIEFKLKLNIKKWMSHLFQQLKK